MKRISDKIKRYIKRVFSAAEKMIEKVKTILIRWEDRFWRLEDRMPRLKKCCCVTYSFFKRISDAVQSFFQRIIDSVRNKALSKTRNSIYRKKMPEWLFNLTTRIKALFKRIHLLLSKKMLFWALALDTLLLVWGLMAKVSILFVLVMAIWSDILIYALSKMEKRAMLLMLSVTFFVFLLGREFLQRFIYYQSESFPVEVQNHTYVCLLLALLGLIGGYSLIKRKETRAAFLEESCNTSVQKVSKMILLITMIPVILYRLILIIFVQKNGYAAYFTDFAALLDKNVFLYVLSKIEQVVPSCICIYMAAMPKKRDFLKVAGVYIFYLLLTLGVGTRSTFLLGIFLMLFYALYRANLKPEEGWFRRKYIFICVVAFVVFALVSYFGGLVRDGQTGTGGSILNGLFGFIYSQGVSINVIKRGYMLQDLMPDDFLYSMDFTRYGIIGRILGHPVYAGNTVEQALYGGSFAHALSYVFMKESYLSGRGTGTSYIAELYYDFGYIGVIVGSLFYGWLCTKIETYKEGKVFKRAFLFIMITQLLWAPRGGFTKIITIVTSPASLFSLIAVFGLAWLMERRKKWRSAHREGIGDGE